MLPLKNCYIVCTGPNGVKETESNGDTAAGERAYASSDYNHGYYNHSHWQYGSPYHKQNKWRSWRNWYPRRRSHDYYGWANSQKRWNWWYDDYNKSKETNTTTSVEGSPCPTSTRTSPARASSTEANPTTTTTTAATKLHEEEVLTFDDDVPWWQRADRPGPLPTKEAKLRPNINKEVGGALTSSPTATRGSTGTSSSTTSTATGTRLCTFPSQPTEPISVPARDTHPASPGDEMPSNGTLKRTNKRCSLPNVDDASHPNKKVRATATSRGHSVQQLPSNDVGGEQSSVNKARERLAEPIDLGNANDGNSDDADNGDWSASNSLVRERRRAKNLPKRQRPDRLARDNDEDSARPRAKRSTCAATPISATSLPRLPKRGRILHYVVDQAVQTD